MREENEGQRSIEMMLNVVPKHQVVGGDNGREGVQKCPMGIKSRESRFCLAMLGLIR